MAGPLAGLRIIDLTEGIAGPFATKQLADYGADVVKVERPGGDPARHLGPFPGDQPDPERAGLFAYLNTNKRGVVLDLDSEAGQTTVRRLTAGADALVENFAPGYLAERGLGYQQLAAGNNRLVFTSLTEFGQRGPAVGRRETDLTIFARSAWLVRAGEPDREPIKYYGNQTEYLAGLHAAFGTAIALLHAILTGRGQYVDVSKYEATLMTEDQGILGSAYIPGHDRPRTGRHSLRFPGAIMPVADGYVSLLVTDLQWPRFCRMAGRPDYAVDPQLATQDGRIARFEELELEFIPWFLSRTKADVFEIAQQFGVPIAPFFDIADVFDNPHYRSREFFHTVEHPTLGAIEITGAPAAMSRSRWTLRRPAPLLDQHRADILDELGLSHAERDALGASA